MTKKWNEIHTHSHVNDYTVDSPTALHYHALMVNGTARRPRNNDVTRRRPQLPTELVIVLVIGPDVF